MDSSTTVYEMAKYLRPDMNLKVLTNDLMIGAELAVLPGVEAHVIGGMIRKEYSTGAFIRWKLKIIAVWQWCKNL